MIILREKEFGQVKKENKAKKRSWEFSLGKEKLKKDYRDYLDFNKSHGFEPISADTYVREKVNEGLGDIRLTREFKGYEGNNFDLKPSDSVRSIGRKSLIEIGNDEILNKEYQKLWNGSLNSYYKDKVTRRNFEKDRLNLKNEEDLLDKYFRNRKIKDNPEPVINRSSIKPMTKIKRFFKKNINKLIK